MDKAKQALTQAILERRQVWVEDVQALYEDGFISYQAYLNIDTYLLDVTAADLAAVAEVTTI